MRLALAMAALTLLSSAAGARLVEHASVSSVEEDVYVVLGEAVASGAREAVVDIHQVLRSPAHAPPPRRAWIGRGHLRGDAGGRSHGLFLVRWQAGRLVNATEINPVLFIARPAAGAPASLHDLLRQTIAHDDRALCLAVGQPGCEAARAAEVRTEAARALVELKDDRAAAAFHGLASHPDVAVAVHGHAGLALMGILHRVPEVAGLIRQAPPALTPALAQLGLAVATAPPGEAARQASLVVLGSPDASLRRDGAAGLKHSALPDDLQVLQALLQDPDGRVRHHAVGGLARLYGENSPSLPAFQRTEAEALAQVSRWLARGRPAVPVADDSPRVVVPSVSPQRM